MKRDVLVVACVGLLLLASVSAKRQVLQWGQQTIRSPGSYRMPFANYVNSFGEPEWLPADILGDAEVEDIRAGPSGSMIWKSVEGKWFVSGIAWNPNNGATGNYYYPVELNFSATVIDPAVSTWQMLDLNWYHGWSSFGTTPVSGDIFAFLNNTDQSDLYAMPSLHNVKSWEPSSPFSWGPSRPSGPLTNTACLSQICVFTSAGVPYISGTFSNPMDPMLGPNANVQLETPAVVPAWTSLCGVASSISQPVDMIALGSKHVVSVSSVGNGQVINLWGNNSVFQLGSSALSSKCWSMNVNFIDFAGLAVNTRLTAISVGFHHNMARFSNGVVYTWGDNSRGQLGLGTSSSTVLSSFTPTQVSFPNTPAGLAGAGSAPNITFIGAWGMSSFAADSNGLVYGWGSNAAPNSIYPPITHSTFFDGGLGVLGFGRSRPTLSHLSSATRLNLPIPDGAQLLKISSALLYDDASVMGSWNGDHVINFIFDVPDANLVSYTSPKTPNTPFQNPVVPGDNVVVTWGSLLNSGVANYWDSRSIPGPVIVDLPRKMPLASFGDITISHQMVHIQNRTSGGLWYFGINGDRLPSTGPGFRIETPYNTWNASEGYATNSTLRTIVTNDFTIYQTAVGTPSDFVCLASPTMTSPRTTLLVSSADYASSSSIRNIRSGPKHWIIEYTDDSIKTCTANCQVRTANDVAPWLGRSSLSKCGAPSVALAGKSVKLSAASDSMTLVWACTNTNACNLITFGNRLLGRTQNNFDDTGAGNLVDLSIVSAHLSADALPTAVKQIECGSTLCAVLLSSGTVIGWGNLTSIINGDTFYPTPFAIIVSNSFATAGENVIEISTVSGALFALTNQGKIYGMGRSRTDESATDMTSFPFFAPFMDVPADQLRYLEELQFINGVQYFYTKLMSSSSLDGVDMLVPYLAIGYATAPVPSYTQPPPTSSSGSAESIIMSWGDNTGDVEVLYDYTANQAPILANGDAVPLVTKPTQSFSWLSTPATSSFNGSSGLLFDASTATFTYSAEHVYALTPTGDVWYWGTGLSEQGVHPSAPDYDEPTDGPMLLMRDVAKIAAVRNGVVYVQKDGLISCSSTSTNQACSSYGVLNSTTNAAVIYNPSTDTSGNAPTAPFSDIACSTIDSRCAVVSEGVAYLLTSEFTGDGLSLDSVMNNMKVSKVWIAAARQANTTAPYYHWLYNRTHFDEQGLPIGYDNAYGWSNLGNAETIRFVGLFEANVSKVVSGATHMLALLHDGTLAGWGYTDYGQLGFYERFVIPVSIPVHSSFFGVGQSLVAVKDIAASSFASVALSVSGDVYTWGMDGQIDPTSTTSHMSSVLSLDESAYAPVFGSPSQTATFVISRDTPKRIASGTLITKLISGPSTGFTGSAPSMIARFFALSSIPAAPAPAPIAPTPTAAPITPPIPPQTCAPPQPRLATCVFLNNRHQWVITQQSLPTNGSAIVINNNVIIEGNLTVSEATPIVIRALKGGQLPTVNVSECANISSPIAVQLDDEDLKSISKMPGGKTSGNTVVESSCLSVASTASRAIKVQSSGKKCRKTSSNTEESDPDFNGRTGLVTVISVNSSSCNNWWIILVSVVGGVVLLCLVVVIIYFSSSKVRAAFTPYRDTNA